MPRIPRETEPFFKWDPDGTNARARAEVRASIGGADAPTTTRAERRTRFKRWLLRWAWALSTGMLLLGYAIMALVLTGHGDVIGI